MPAKAAVHQRRHLRADNFDDIYGAARGDSSDDRRAGWFRQSAEGRGRLVTVRGGTGFLERTANVRFSAPLL